MARIVRSAWRQADLDTDVLPEHGEQPVAQELVDPAAMLGDGGADDGEELVQHEDDVERQPLLREAREVAQVDEHDGERLLHAAESASSSSAASGPAVAAFNSRVTTMLLGRGGSGRRAARWAARRCEPSVTFSGNVGGGKRRRRLCRCAPGRWSSARDRRRRRRAAPWTARLISRSVGPCGTLIGRAARVGDRHLGAGETR